MEIDREAVAMGALRRELEVIASCELGDVLDSWDARSDEQNERLARYLRSEWAPFGMLSNEKARECGMSLSRERREARAILRKIGG